MSYAESNAICNPRASRDSISFIPVMYKCRWRNRSISLPSSACSNSNSLSKCMNHSKETWSRLIQKKSTYDKNELIIPTLCYRLEEKADPMHTNVFIQQKIPAKVLNNQRVFCYASRSCAGHGYPSKQLKLAWCFYILTSYINFSYIKISKFFQKHMKREKVLKKIYHQYKFSQIYSKFTNKK